MVLTDAPVILLLASGSLFMLAPEFLLTEPWSSWMGFLLSDVAGCSKHILYISRPFCEWREVLLIKLEQWYKLGPQGKRGHTVTLYLALLMYNWASAVPSRKGDAVCSPGLAVCARLLWGWGRLPHTGVNFVRGAAVLSPGLQQNQVTFCLRSVLGS